MAEEEKKDDRPFVERWLEDQQEWQKTMLTYMDSMANNEDFLVHLGNAMRGSLLAGKPYPGTTSASTQEAERASPADASAADERIDRILFALHELQGQLNDLQLTVDKLVAASQSSPVAPTAASEAHASHQPDTPAEAGTAHATQPERDG